LRKDNEASKKEAKLLAKQKKMGKSVVVEDKDETEPEEKVNEDSYSEKTHKRKSESDEDDDDEPIEKKPKREAQKKKKQERKRMKREAALKESLANTENERKKREQLDHDILVKSTIDQKVKTNLTNETSTEHVQVGGNKKRKETAETKNDSEPIKKAKISINGEAEDLHLKDQSHIDETSLKKNCLNVEPESLGVVTSIKKKKKKIRDAEVIEKISSSIPEENLKEESTPHNSDEPKLKKKKKKIKEAEVTEEINSSITVKNENEELTLTHSDEPSLKKKKKEKVAGLESRQIEVTVSSGKKKKMLKTELTEKVGSVDSVENKIEEVVISNGDNQTPKKKKKKKVLDSESDSHKNKKTNELNGTEEVNSKVTEENEETIKKSNPKLKKKKKEMHRIDSDICFNAPSLSKTNLSLEDMQEKPKPQPLPTLAPITEVSTPTLPASQKKKMKKYKAEVSLSTASPENACVAGKLDFGNSNGKVK